MSFRFTATAAYDHNDGDDYDNNDDFLLPRRAFFAY